MPKKSNKYWQQRFDQIEQGANNQSVAYIQTLEEKYRSAAKEIDEKINTWYQRLARNNGVSITEAKKLLNDSELAEFKWTVEQYIKAGEENAVDQRWMKELENASAKFHINRLEAMKIEARQQIEVATGGMVDDIDGMLKNVYSDTFYRSCFEIQKGAGVGFDVSKLDDGKVSKLLKKPWSVDGVNFSEKLWGNKAKLINSLDQELSRMVLTGETPQKAIANIKKAMGTSMASAKRLVMTEQAYFTSVAQKDAFGELDVEEFEFVGTLDGETCSDCGDLDGKHFPVAEMAVGVNAPPMHPYCRCTTCPYFDDEFTNGLRASRDEAGKTVYEVPANITYPEWYDAFVERSHKLDNSPLNIIGKRSRIKTPIDDCENFEDMQSYFNTKYGAVIDKDVLPLNFETVKEITGEFETVMEEFPWCKDSFYGLNTHNAGKASLSPLGELCFNPKLTMEYNPQIFGSGYHEAGHLMEIALIKRKYPEIRMDDIMEKLNSSELAKEIVKDAYSNIRTQKTLKELREEISKQSLKNMSETMADAVKDYMLNGGGASILSRQIIKELRRIK